MARTIKAEPKLADTRIVILTSIAFHPDEADFRRLGISAYLTKPVKQSRLMDCLAVKNWPRRSKQRPACRHSPAAFASQFFHSPTRNLVPRSDVLVYSG